MGPRLKSIKFIVVCPSLSPFPGLFALVLGLEALEPCPKTGHKDFSNKQLRRIVFNFIILKPDHPVII